MKSVKVIMLVLLCGLRFQADAKISFLPPVSYPVGAQPQAVIATDINGDGKVDLICANTGDDSLTILTNDGTGNYALASSPGVGSYPTAVTAADLYGDGKMALISANYSGNTISILTNNGGGSFALVSSLGVDSSPNSVVVADINGDGKNDIIVANNGSGTLSILTNNGAGGFALASSPAVGPTPDNVIWVDLYGDGHRELVTANDGENAICILTNGGYGQFAIQTKLSVGSNSKSVAAADVNGDGYLDLITANYGHGSGNTLTILTNDHRGGFVLASSPQVDRGPTHVLAADLIGNGTLELVSVNLAGSITLLTNNGGGNFVAATNLPVNSGPYGAAVADVYGSGNADLIVSSRSYNTISVLKNITGLTPQIIVDLQNLMVKVGSNTTFSVTVLGAQPLAYQWYFVPASNAGEAGAYAETISGFVYGAVVTNGGFGYGNVPAISFVGGGGSGAAGYGTVSNAVLTGIVVTNAGSGYSSTPAVVIARPNGLLWGQTNSFLTVSNVSQDSLGSYFVVITNIYGAATSSVAGITLAYPPSITLNPSGFITNYQSSGSLTVIAAGTAPLSYQWILNNTNVISGATNTTYTISSLNLTDTGAYTVEVFNPYGVAFTTPAYVEMVPALTTPFAGASAIRGENTLLSVGAIGSGLLTYQWYFNGMAIPGATSNTYALNGIQFTNAGLYSVVVSSAYGSVTNQAYQVVVNPAGGVVLGLCPMVYINGTPGHAYAIQSTTNLGNSNAWVTVTNITIPTSPYIWADTATDTLLPSNPHRFYRMISGQ